jgi:hypothetical protein
MKEKECENCKELYKKWMSERAKCFALEAELKYISREYVRLKYENELVRE